MRFLSAFVLALAFLQVALADWRDSSGAWGVSGGYGNDNRTPSGAVSYPNGPTITLEVWIDGITVNPGASPNLTCIIWRSPESGSNWFGVTMSYDGQNGNNDVYKYTYEANIPKTYYYTFKCLFNDKEQWFQYDDRSFTITEIVCPENSFKTSGTTCGDCPDGSTGPAGSTTIEDCACSVDSILNTTTNECLPITISCDENEYFSTGGACEACPAHSSGPGGQVAITSCECTEGRILSISRASCFCNSSSYDDNGTCALCPEGSSSNGGTKVGDCKCADSTLVMDSYAKICRQPIKYVRNLQPFNPTTSPSRVRLPSALQITLQVFKPDVTPGEGQGLGINCYLYTSSKLNDDFSGSWNPQVFPMNYSSSVNEADVYSIDYLPSEGGSYSYAAYCLDENSNVQHWREESGNGNVIFRPAPCLAGDYLDGSTCTGCPDTASSPADSLSIDYCVCPEGQYVNTNSKACLPSEATCPASQYTTDGVNCASCPSGSTSPANSTSISACTCLSPMLLDISQNSCLCPANFYRSSSTECEICPDGSTSDLGSDNVLDCACANGKVMDSIDKVCRDPIAYVGNVSPNSPQSSPTLVYLEVPVTITLEVYKSAVTDPEGQGHEILCYLYLSPPLNQNFEGSWDQVQSLAMYYVSDSGNNDVYGIDLSLDPGYYAYAAYCLDAHSTEKHWRAGDNGYLIFLDLCASNWFDSNGTCEECPSGATSNAGSTSITACNCTVGTLDVDLKECTVPSTPTPTPTPTPTTTPTSTPTTTTPTKAPKTGFVKATFRVTNILYTWYTASQDNKDLFDSSFINLIKQLVLSATKVEIVSVKQGSLIVTFKVTTTEPQEATDTLNAFLASGDTSLAPLANSLPSEAFENASEGVAVDASSSTAEVGKDLPLGAIIGGVVGGFFGLLFIVIIVYLLARKGKKNDAYEMSKR